MLPRKLLSLWAPWWLFVVKGWKPLENREWQYPPSYRGRVWIHAALKSDRDCDDLVSMVFEDKAFGIPQDAERPTAKTFADSAGHLVGSARIVDITLNTPAICAANPWAAEGQLGIRLADVEELATPIPWKGGQGLVDVDPEMVALVALMAEHGHKLDFGAVPESIVRWLVRAQHDGVNTNDLLGRAVDQKQLRREKDVYFTRAYKTAPTQRPAPAKPPRTKAPPQPAAAPEPAPAAPPLADPRQTAWEW